MAAVSQYQVGQQVTKQNDEDPTQSTCPTQFMSIQITENGPYLVSGFVPLLEEVITPIQGHLEYRQRHTYPLEQTYALCRCGHTKTPPFCDGVHKTIPFDGTETADRNLFVQRADVYRGPGVSLLDDNRCAFARFCHREDGDVWTLTERSGHEQLKHEAIKASSDCPSGRLVHYDAADRKSYEPDLEPAISLLQDPEQGVSGPLFVRGGIRLISAEGEPYELRNRYALCRCGASEDKPFCDAMHVSCQFTDGINVELV